jgi:predicted secreted hydrolase
MNVRALSICIGLLWPFDATGQGFAGLGAGGEGFAMPERGTPFDFPADHGAHPEYRIEWWYLTANLTGPDGTPYGLQWTLFRSALAPEEGSGWTAPQVWMGHAAVTLPDRHLVAERLARGGIGQAGVVADPFSAWIDDWQLAGDSFDRLRMTASGPDFAYDMALTAEGPLVFHGDDGYSVKSAEGQASYYYSQPFFAIDGVISLADREIPVTGRAWLDREWSSQPLSEGQTGWDWFSLVFDDGNRLMGFRLRGAADYTSATWIEPDGTTTAYPDGAFVAEPLTEARVAGRDVPVEWRVQLPDRGIDVTVAALNEQAWMGVSIPYWEGPISRCRHAHRHGVSGDDRL